MISWIQKYFQHHFKTIFAVLLGVTIISFIFTIGAAPGIGRADRQSIERRVFGYNLSSQEDSNRLFGDASLSAMLQYGFAPDGAELQNYGLLRAASLKIADDLHLPAASKQEITDFIKNLRSFAGQDGQFDAARYAQFRDSLKTNPRMNEARVGRVLSDDIRMSKVQKLLSGPGYVQASDVKTQLEKYESSWTLAVATVDYASYNPAIATTEAILTKYFEDNALRYEIPPQVVASYVEFSVLPLLSQVNVTEAEARAFYDANPTRFPKPAPADPKAAPAKADPAADFAAVRSQVETTLKLERSRQIAAKAASDFSYALYERKLAPSTPGFDEFVAAQKLTVRNLAPFTREQGPLELGGLPEIAEEAFKLGKDRAYSDAVSAPGGSVVLFWKETVPAHKPLYTEVKDKVAADYLDGEKRKKFIELGRTLRTAIESRVKAGETFDKAAAAVAATNGVKIDTKTYPAFSRRQPAQDIDYSVMSALDRLEKGRVSDMLNAKDHGLIVYAVDKKLPDLSETSPQFVTTREQIALATARDGAGAFLGQLVSEELKRSEPAVEK